MAIDQTSLLLATNNQGKIREMRELFINVPYVLKNLSEFPNIIEVDETGLTFEENAVLKAQGYARQTGLPTLADDSGLEVLALGNAPGVLSARYAGADTSFEIKMAKLLEEIGNKIDVDRSARFICVMALADKTGRIIFTAEGKCEGKIALQQTGAGGFGYDPIFIPEGFEMTFGELSDTIKHGISHRKRASDRIIRYLNDNTVI